MLGHRDVVAVRIGDDALAESLEQMLVDAGRAVGGQDAIGSAAMIVTDARADVAATIAELRKLARSDAAIVVVIEEPFASHVAEAHRAGAFACLRRPIVAEEALALVDSAIHSQSAKRQIADLSKRLDLETHLASIGRITAGLSHEFASPLGAAEANLDYVRRRLDALSEARDHLRQIAFAPIGEHEKRALAARTFLEHSPEHNSLAEAVQDAELALQRARKLLDTMKQLVRQERRPLAPTDVVAVARDVCKNAVAQFGGRATIELSVDTPLVAMADRTLLEQLLTNLVSNAVHAAETLPSPRVRVHVYGASHEAIVSVRDNGRGIALADQEKIFEPFFTTRRELGGTGLGLALCREYAVQMGAKLTLWSMPQRGACFRVQLPLAPESAPRS